TVTLEKANRCGRITVSDHGKGFDADTVMKDAQVAHGLLIIQDRLKLLGCQVAVQSKPGNGTQIVIDIPEERSPA
ncbi:MAG TPA: ATP-binding protein, partial [Anaerolineales bacterium]|nr:ATP-binding protein [Anaerolineales bacterium]